MKNKFYITTPIYYATAKPHLGSLYSTVLADISAKWNKLQGKETFFLTGTDEHGQKIAQEAQKLGMLPRELVDKHIDDYKHIWKLFGIDYNRFIRTTELGHVKAVQNWLQAIIDSGFIYKDKYEGWYCTHCETFVTNEVHEDTTVILCPSCSRPTSKVAEESYFFELSAFQDKLLKFYKENPDFVTPKERLNEVISFVESGLNDLSISRTTVKWGIPFPGDDKHITYVWADALLNYITAIGYGDENHKKDFEKWWPVDAQIMGKDILRFHAIYWPAFLMASGLELPKKLVVHGWIKVNQQKMSKSLGNVVDPEDLYKSYGSDAVRYYLASQLAITHDAEFSAQAIEKHITTDLANDLGNLLNRMIALAFKNDLIQVPAVKTWSTESETLRQDSLACIAEYSEQMDKYYYHLALAALWKFIGKVNAYFHAHEPWKLSKTDPAKFMEVISATCHSLNVIGNLTWPVMPIKSQELLDQISQDEILDGNKIELLKKDWSKSFYLKKGPALFNKIEEVVVQQQPEAVILKKENPEINIEEFLKIQLVVGSIEQVNEVPKSDKLFKLHVNFGDKGTRQILSGIKQYFVPEDLIGKQAVFVFNLASRKMMGLESHGMLLTAQSSELKIEIIRPENPVPNGTMLK